MFSSFFFCILVAVQLESSRQPRNLGHPPAAELYTHYYFFFFFYVAQCSVQRKIALFFSSTHTRKMGKTRISITYN